MTKKIIVSIKNIDKDLWWQAKMRAAMRHMTIQEHVTDLLERDIAQYRGHHVPEP